MNPANKIRIVSITPLPPPITGAAESSRTIVDYLSRKYEVISFSTSKDQITSGKFYFGQFLRILLIGLRLIKLRLKKNEIDAAYLVIASTFWGNIRDLFFLFILGKELRKKTVLHFHSANMGAYLGASQPWLKKLNQLMLNDVSKVIVLAPSLVGMFSGYLLEGRVMVVNNCCKEELMITKEALCSKYDAFSKVTILFLSNMMREKGYEILLDAFLSLPAALGDLANLLFAGEFAFEGEKSRFLRRIAPHRNVAYLGVVRGEEKKKLFHNAHIFCLPTYYPHECQPISIIEALAAGCMVITTNQGAIEDIFSSGIKGLIINTRESKSDLTEAVKDFLRQVISEIKKYEPMVYSNVLKVKKRYKSSDFCMKIETALLGQK